MKRWISILVVVVVLITAMPTLAANETVGLDQLMSKLETLISQVTRLQQETTELKKVTDELHKIVVGEPSTPPTVFIVKADGSKPISSAEGDTVKAELLDLTEEKGSVFAKVRLIVSTSETATWNYRVSLESGRSRYTSDQSYFYDVPPGTTREVVFAFKGAAGQLTPDGYISITWGWRGGEVRLPLVAKK